MTCANRFNPQAKCDVNSGASSASSDEAGILAGDDSMKARAEHPLPLIWSETPSGIIRGTRRHLQSEHSSPHLYSHGDSVRSDDE